MIKFLQAGGSVAFSWGWTSNGPSDTNIWTPTPELEEVNHYLSTIPTKPLRTTLDPVPRFTKQLSLIQKA